MEYCMSSGERIMKKKKRIIKKRYSKCIYGIAQNAPPYISDLES